MKNKNQLLDSFLLCWPLFIISTFYEICILKIGYGTLSIFFISCCLVLFKVLIFPLLLFFELLIDYTFLKILMPDKTTDRSIDAILGSSLSPCLFLIIPLLGPVAFFISSKLNFLVGIRQFLSWGESLTILFFPTLLSIVFMTFFVACAALLILKF